MIVSPNISGEKYLRRNSVESFKSCLRDDIQAIRLKYVIAQSITDGPHLTPEFTSSGVPFLSVDGIQDGELFFENCRFISENDHYEFRKKAAPQYGDILLGKAASTGKIARVKTTKEFSIWSPLALIRPNSDVISSAFLEYSLKSLYLQVQIEDLCSFNTQKNISMGAIPNLVIPLPSLEEQKKITDYIDRETTQIDNLIAAKEQMLTLLEEKREALISHAVTRGLDPNVAFKRSGLDWLGDIPQHWQVLKIKYLTKIVRGQFSHRPRNDPKLYGGKYPFIQTGDVANANKFILEYSQTLNEDGYAVSKEFPSGTLVMTIAANIGDMAILNFNACFPDSVVGFVPSNKTEILFLYYLFRSMRNQFLSTAVLNTQLNLNVERISNLVTVIPPVSEQTQITDYLDREISKMDELLAALTDSIALLKERRSALITAAVTGQIALEENYDYNQP